MRAGSVISCLLTFFFFFQAEDGIRDLVRSRGLGDVYKRQMSQRDPEVALRQMLDYSREAMILSKGKSPQELVDCLLYTSDAADDLLCVDLGGRRIIKKKNQTTNHYNP